MANIRYEPPLLPGESARYIDSRSGRYVTNRAPLPEFTPQEATAYALWCEEASEAAAKRNLARAEQLERKPGMRGKVLTENGWEIPSGPLNPRVIDQASGALTAYDRAREAAIQAEVATVAADHEHAVRSGDMWEFQRMYRDGELPERFYG